MRSLRTAFLIALASIPLWAASAARAGIARETYVGAEPMAMGNAYIAIADDEHAVFYNPAGVAAYKRISLHYLSLDLSVTEDSLAVGKTAKDLKDPSGATLNRYLGKNLGVTGRGGAFLLAPHFGFGAYYDAQGSLLAKNAAFPKVEFGYQRTTVAQGAFAMSSQERKRRGRKKDGLTSEWRFGMAGKIVRRRGGFAEIPAAQLFSLSQETILGQLKGDGSGFGLDFGVQRIQALDQSSTVNFGAVFTDLGSTKLGDNGNLHHALGLGVAYNLYFAGSRFTVAYDWRQVLASDDWRKKSHLGARYSILLFDFFAGLNQVYLTYGASVDLWLLKATLYSYAEDRGAALHQYTERRYALRIDLKF